MDILVFKDYYDKITTSPGTITGALEAFKEFTGFLASRDEKVETTPVSFIKEYIALRIAQNRNSPEDLLALARGCRLAGNNKGYIYFTQILEREDILANLSRHIADTVGKKTAEELLGPLSPPPVGAPPETALPYTAALVRGLSSRLDPDRCRRALTANAHGIPEESFAGERERLRSAGSLEAYLEAFHAESVKTLEKHARSGEVWFEQIITPAVVEYVRSHPEVLGGILEGRRIYLTKIPYDPDGWLKETDPVKKRYLACHCPMAREALKEGPHRIPPAWCRCSAGFARLRFNVLFGKEAEIEVMESVLAGGEVCRFALTVPEEFL